MDDGFFVGNFAANADFAAGCGKFDCVAYQIPEDLQETRAIPSHKVAVTIVHLQVEFNIVRGGNGTHGFDGFAHHGRERDGQFLHPHFAA